MGLWIKGILLWQVPWPSATYFSAPRTELDQSLATNMMLVTSRLQVLLIQRNRIVTSSVTNIVHHSLEDFVEAIRRLVTPTRSRKLIVEVLSGSLNFKLYLEGLDVVITGLTPNPRGSQPQLHTNHCWRFVRRMEPCLELGFFLGQPFCC